MLHSKGMMKKINIKKTHTHSMLNTLKSIKFESDCCVAYCLKSKVAFKP